MTSGSSDHAAFRRALRRSAAGMARPLPWIGHQDPWAILVSEFMLQQTQVSRVLEPWSRFVGRFATPSACAQASLSEVLTLWAGLGYHRRAKMLHESARVIRDEFAGLVPSHSQDLLRLPGVGPYTARAVASFAFGERAAVLDTNVGRVLARCVAGRRLSTFEAWGLAYEVLPRSGEATHNQAMLDLGAQFCRARPVCEVCPMAKVCRWREIGGPDPAVQSAGVSRPQSRFEGSDRQLRGRVLAELRRAPAVLRSIARHLESDDARSESILLGLQRDGLVERVGRSGRWQLAQGS